MQNAIFVDSQTDKSPILSGNLAFFLADRRVEHADFAHDLDAGVVV